jgi:hypothetical protein
MDLIQEIRKLEERARSSDTEAARSRAKADAAHEQLEALEAQLAEQGITSWSDAEQREVELREAAAKALKLAEQTMEDEA